MSIRRLLGRQLPPCWVEVDECFLWQESFRKFWTEDDVGGEVRVMVCLRRGLRKSQGSRCGIGVDSAHACISWHAHSFRRGVFIHRMNDPRPECFAVHDCLSRSPRSCNFTANECSARRTADWRSSSRGRDGSGSVKRRSHGGMLPGNEDILNRQADPFNVFERLIDRCSRQFQIPCRLRCTEQ